MQEHFDQMLEIFITSKTGRKQKILMWLAGCNAMSISRVHEIKASLVLKDAREKRASEKVVGFHCISSA